MTSKTTITLAQLARDLNIDPKVARAKARRRSDELPKTVRDDNWIFPASAKSKLIEFLNGSPEIERQQFRKLKPDQKPSELKQTLADSVKLEAAKPVAKKSRKPS